MTIRNLGPELTAHPFLAGLRPEHIERIVPCAENRRYEAGAYAAREGEPAREFYLIRDGHIALEVFTPQTGARRILSLHAGEVCGWSWLVEPYLWKFDARAVSATRVMAIDGTCLRRKCEHDFELGYRLFQRVSRIIEDRLMATRLQLLDLYRGDGAAAGP